MAPSRERIRRSTHARSTPDDLENPKARSASATAIALRQTMQVLQGRAAQHVAGQGEAAADCGVRPRSRCRIPVVVTKLPACNSLRAPRSAPCSVRATPTSCPHRALKTLQYEPADGCGARATDATDSLLVVNLKVTKAIGLVISETFIVRGPLLTLLTFYAPRSGLRVITAAIWAPRRPDACTLNLCGPSGRPIRGGGQFDHRAWPPRFYVTARINLLQHLQVFRATWRYISLPLRGSSSQRSP